MQLDDANYWKFAHAVEHARWAVEFLPDLKARLVGCAWTLCQVQSPITSGVRCEVMDRHSGQILYASPLWREADLAQTTHEGLRDGLVAELVAAVGL